MNEKQYEGSVNSNVMGKNEFLWESALEMCVRMEFARMLEDLNLPKQLKKLVTAKLCYYRKKASQLKVNVSPLKLIPLAIDEVLNLSGVHLHEADLVKNSRVSVKEFRELKNLVSILS